MIITKIKLKNFISHNDTEIEFPYGVSILMGENGSGKSSIIDSIYYSLCGEQVRGDSINDLIKEGKNSARVILNFQHGGVDYEVSRDRERERSPKATIKKDGVLLTGAQSAVNEEIVRILEMDKNTIVNTVFIRQGEITKLIDGTLGQRKKEMGKLIGINKLEDCWQRINKIINHFESQVREVDVVNKELEISTQQEQDLETAVNGLIEELEKSKEEIKAVEFELETIRKNKESWELKRINYEKLNNEISRTEAKLESNQNHLKDLKARQEEAQSAKVKMDKIQPKIQNIEVLERIVTATQEERSTAKDLKHLEGELRRADDIRAKMAMHYDTHKTYEATYKKLQGHKEAIEEMGEVEIQYTELATKINSSKQTISDLEREIKAIKEVALKVLKKADIYTKEKFIKEITTKVSATVSNISKQVTLLGKTNGRVGEITSYIQKLKEGDMCPICSSELSESRRKQIIADFNSEKTSLVKQIEENVKLSDALKIEEQRLRKELEHINQLEVKKIHSKEEKLQKIESQVKSFENDKAKKELLVLELNSLKTAVKGYEKESKSLQKGFEEYNAALLAFSQFSAPDKIKIELKEISDEHKKQLKVISDLTKKLGIIPPDPEKELNELRVLKDEYGKLSVKHDELNQIKRDIKKSETDSKTISTRLSKLRIETLGYSQEEYDNFMQLYRESESNLKSLRSIDVLKKEDITNKTSELDRVCSNIERLQNRNNELNKIIRFQNLLKDIKAAYSKDGIQKALRRRIAPYITDLARKNLEAFNLNISDIEVDEDLNISLLGRNGKVSVKSISGGEKVAIAIVLRLAIAQIFSNQVSTIIMDEPTTHLDPERRKELVKAMQHFKSESHTVPQLIVVTHHKELEELGDTIFEVELKENTSEVREVTLME